MERYVLSTPVEFDGETVTEINMDLESLSAGALERAEKQARMMLGKKEQMHVPETNKKYLSCVAAKAAGAKVDLIKSLSGKDYTQVCLLVQNFLLDGDSDMEDEQEDQEAQDFIIPASSETSRSTTPMTPNPEDGSTDYRTDLTI